MGKVYCCKCGEVLGKVKVLPFTERNLPICPDCKEEEAVGVSFIDDAHAMALFDRSTRTGFLRDYGWLYNKRDYAATIRELGYAHFCKLFGWEVQQSEEDHSIYISQNSPAGDDFGFEITCDGTLEEFAHEIYEYWQNFDIDDYIDMRIEARHNGVSGVPTTRELVKDAEAIDCMLETLSDFFEQIVRELHD